MVKKLRMQPRFVQAMHEDVGGVTLEHTWELIYDRCKNLYSACKTQGMIFGEPGREGEFMVMPSDQFYKSIVDWGGGSMANSIMTRGETFYLLWEDRSPTRYWPMPAEHEREEVVQVRDSRRDTHQLATLAEILRSKELAMKDEYLSFLSEEYPQKFQDICNYKYLFV